MGFSATFRASTKLTPLSSATSTVAECSTSYIHGSSYPTGSEPAEDGLTVENMATTVYRCLGINADKRLMAPGNRPIDIVRGGTVVQELLA